MSSTTFTIGDRVMLIPFQHKGKIATVKYFGSIGKKFGTWVGLELDEPTGDSNGDVNGEQLFECKEMHGLILRNTQVRHYDATAPVVQRTTQIQTQPIQQEKKEGLTIEGDLTEALEQKLHGLSGTTLLPTANSFISTNLDSDNILLNKVNEALTSMDQSIRSSFAGSMIDPDKAAAKGWQARLASLKQKKAEDKKAQETNAGTDLDNEAADLRSQFAIGPGIKKDEKGKLIVTQEEVKVRLDGDAILKKIEERDILEAQKAAAEPEPTTPLPVEKKVNATPSALTKPGHGRMVSNADKIKEKAVALEAERKNRQSIIETKNTAGPVSRNTLQQTLKTTGNLNQSLNSKTSVLPKANPLNTTQKLANKEDAKAPAEKAGITRQGSTSRLGIGIKTSEKDSTPGLKRDNSSSRLSLADRPQANVRQPSSNRTKPGDSGLQTARGASRDKLKVDLNTSLGQRKVGEKVQAQAAMNKTQLLNKTPMKDATPTRPATTLTKPVVTAISKPEIKSLLKPGAQPTPIDYKKMEILLNEKNTEIQCLQEEVQGLTARINEITAVHEQQLSELNENKKNDLERQKEIYENEKLKFQTEQEEITERLMNMSPESGAQNQQIMEMAQQQLTQIKEEQNKKLLQEQEKFVKLQGELNELKQEQQLKINQIEELRAQVELLKSQIIEQQTIHANEIQVLQDQIISAQSSKDGNTQEILSQQKLIQKQLEQKFGDYQKNAEVTRLQDIQKYESLIKELQKKTMDQATTISELEVQRAEESELHMLELEQVKDEKEEILQQLLQQGKVDEVDPLSDLGLEEIKVQNKKLRNAITSLTFGFEEERRKQETAFKADTSKDRKIASLEEKIKELDFLYEEVVLKEQERAEMQQKLEDIVGYENMIDEMVQEIAKKEEEIEEVRDNLAESQEEGRLMEDLNNQLEQYNKELTQEIEQKDERIIQLKSEIDQLETIVVEQDGLADKYKDRLAELQKQLKLTNEQLQDYTQDGSRDQVSILLEKQQNLIRSLRQAESKQLLVQRNFVELWQGRTYSELVAQILPLGLQKEAQLESYVKVQLLNTLRHKATLFLREVCEKQLDQAAQIYEEKDQFDSFIILLQRLSQHMNSIINFCAIIQFQIANSSPETYREIIKVATWDRIPVIITQVDTITDLMNNQSISYSFDTNDFTAELKSLETLSTKVEKLFSNLSPEETKQAETQGIAIEKAQQNCIPLQRRKNLVEHVAKLKLRNASFNMALAVCFVSLFSKDQADTKSVQQKCKLIYLRLLDTIMKIDHIPNDDEGNDYIDTKQLNTELRLQQKLDSIAVLWQGSNQEMQEKRTSSWLSVLEAIERDITMLNNDFKFKRLIKLVDQKYGSQKINFDDLYKLDYQANGPWRQIAQNIKTELQDMTALKQKNTQLQEKQKDSMIQSITLKKEKDEAMMVQKQLETKLSLALAKAEQVPALEIEKKDLDKKFDFIRKQLDQQKAEFEKSQNFVSDLTKKLEEAKKVQASQPPPEQQQSVQPQQQQQAGALTAGRPNIRARYLANKHSSRQSRSAKFYSTLQISNGFNKSQDPNASHNRMPSQNVNVQNLMQQHLQQTQMNEDIYMQIIAELQYDRLRLKAKDMAQRIARLSVEGSCFNSLMKSFNQVEVRLNKDESNLIQGAIQEVSKLKFGMKKNMAKARVIDLSKSDQRTVELEQFNQQVNKAKSTVNDTLELLFSMDSKFKVIEKQEVLVETKKVEGSALSEIKIGEIKLRGKIQLPTRKVILDEHQLGDLRRNLALFSC